MSEADQLLVELRQLRSMGLLTGENAAIAAEYRYSVVVETSAVANRTHIAAVDAEGARISALNTPEIQQAQAKVAAAKQDLTGAKRTLKNLEDYIRKHDHEWRVYLDDEGYEKVRTSYDGTTSRGAYEYLDDEGRDAARCADHKVSLAEQQVAAVIRRLDKAEKVLKQLRPDSWEVPLDPNFESECDALLDIGAACEAARAVIKKRQLLIAARKLDQRDGIGEHPEPS